MSRPAKILVVDDDEAIRELLHCALAQIGDEVVCVSDVAAARVYLQSVQNRIDVAILDCVMAGESPHVLARELTALGVPVIRISGDQTEVPEGAGDPRVLSKPFPLSDLFLRLAESARKGV